MFRGRVVAGSDSLAIVAPLSGSLLRSYGGVARFRMLFQQFDFNPGPTVPRALALTITSTTGQQMQYVFKSDSDAALAPRVWRWFTVPLSEEVCTAL